MDLRRKKKGMAVENIMLYLFAVLVIMVVIIGIYRLGIFHFGTATVAVEFSKLKPIVAGVAVSSSDFSFDGNMANTVGTDLRILAVRIYSADATLLCCSHLNAHPQCGALADGGSAAIDIHGKDWSNFAVNDFPLVKKSENFKLLMGADAITQRCNHGFGPDDIFDIRLEIDYLVDTGGITTQHTEYGYIRGKTY